MNQRRKNKRKEKEGNGKKEGMERIRQGKMNEYQIKKIIERKKERKKKEGEL